MLIYLDGNQINSLQVIDETSVRRRVVYTLLFQSLHLQLEVRIWSIVIHIRSVTLFEEGNHLRTLLMRRKFTNLQGMINDIS